MKILHWNIVQRELDWTEGKDVNSGQSPFTDQHFGFECDTLPLWVVSSSANGRGCQGCGVEGAQGSCLWSVVLGNSAAEEDGTHKLFLGTDLTPWSSGSSLLHSLRGNFSNQWNSPKGRGLACWWGPQGVTHPQLERASLIILTLHSCCQNVPVCAPPWGPEEQAGHRQMKELLGIKLSHWTV